MKTKQLTIFDQIQSIIQHFPDKPPVAVTNSEHPTIRRTPIPRDQIIAFIFGQSARLEKLYENHRYHI